MVLTKLNEFSGKKVSCIGNSVYFQKFESNGIFVNYFDEGKTEWSILFEIEGKYKDILIWEDTINRYTIIQTSNSKLYTINKETGEIIFEVNKGVYAYDNNIFIERKKIIMKERKKIINSTRFLPQK